MLMYRKIDLTKNRPEPSDDEVPEYMKEMIAAVERKAEEERITRERRRYEFDLECWFEGDFKKVTVMKTDFVFDAIRKCHAAFKLDNVKKEDGTSLALVDLRLRKAIAYPSYEVVVPGKRFIM